MEAPKERAAEDCTKGEGDSTPKETAAPKEREAPKEKAAEGCTKGEGDEDHAMKIQISWRSFEDQNESWKTSSSLIKFHRGYFYVLPLTEVEEVDHSGAVSRDGSRRIVNFL